MTFKQKYFQKDKSKNQMNTSQRKNVYRKWHLSFKKAKRNTKSNESWNKF